MTSDSWPDSHWGEEEEGMGVEEKYSKKGQQKYIQTYTHPTLTPWKIVYQQILAKFRPPFPSQRENYLHKADKHSCYNFILLQRQVRNIRF